MDLDGFIAALKNPGESLKTAEQLKEASSFLQAHVQPFWQSIFTQGHQVAQEREGAKLTAAQDELKGVRKDLTKAQSTIAELEKKAPDVAELRTQFAQTQADLEKKHTEALAAKDAQILKVNRGRAAADLQRLLESGGTDGKRNRVHQAMVKVMLQDAELLDRLQFDGEGNLQVLGKGTKVPLAVAQGRAPLDVLAEELLGGVDAAFVLSGAEGGTGEQGGPGGAGGGAYDPVKAGKELAAAQKGSQPAADLAFR